MATDQELSDAFKGFADQVVILAKKANEARKQMQAMIDKQTPNGPIETDGTGPGKNGAPIRDYEQAIEDLRALTGNGPGNSSLQRIIQGNKHYIRALEVGLDHKGSKDYLITGVVVRGLISATPNDGNQTPNYSSRSSSSPVPP